MSAAPPPLPVVSPPSSGTGSACVICISSGKGGVGKTSIALSLARELSQAGKVLVMDLDYFNRGATGLLLGKLLLKRKGDSFVDVLSRRDSHGQTEVTDVQIDSIENESSLYFAGCPELSEAAMRRLEDADLSWLTVRLRQLLLQLALELQLSCIVLDAHGGPDTLSFAAASVAHHTILVSDPDKVTLYGTLNFVARLREALPADLQPPPIKLLFNRVSKKFSWRGLSQIYEENLSDLFDGPLLGAVPFLPSVFESFASAPFVSALFPNSLFAKKIRLLSHELLTDQPERLPKVVQKWSKGQARRVRETVQDRSWARPFPIAVTWLLVFLCSFVATLIVALDPENSLLKNLLLFGSGGLAVIFAFLAVINSLLLFFQGIATHYRFQIHTALARLYRWKLFLQITPVVLCSLFVLAVTALLLPALGKAKAKAQRITCVNNMKQIGLSFLIWANDNEDQFPFNVSTNKGGTLEFCDRGADGFDRNAFRHLQVLSNELSTARILVCPSDTSKRVGTNFYDLLPINVTYQVRSGTNVNAGRVWTHDLNAESSEEILTRCPIHHHTGNVDASIQPARGK